MNEMETGHRDPDLFLPQPGDDYEVIHVDQSDGDSESSVVCSGPLTCRRKLREIGALPRLPWVHIRNLRTDEFVEVPSDAECLQQLRHDILRDYDEEQFSEDLKLVLGDDGVRKYQELSDYLDESPYFQLPKGVSWAYRALKILDILEITEIDDE